MLNNKEKIEFLKKALIECKENLKLIDNAFFKNDENINYFVELGLCYLLRKFFKGKDITTDRELKDMVTDLIFPLQKIDKLTYNIYVNNINCNRFLYSFNRSLTIRDNVITSIRCRISLISVLIYYYEL